jgi:hypothetical protein
MVTHLSENEYIFFHTIITETQALGCLLSSCIIHSESRISDEAPLPMSSV